MSSYSGGSYFPRPSPTREITCSFLCRPSYRFPPVPRKRNVSKTFRVIVVKRHDNNNNNIDYGETAVHVRPENTRRHCRRRRRRRRITHRRSGIAGVAFLPSFAPFSGRTWNTRFENRLANVRVQGDSVREGRVMSVNSTRCKRKTAGWPRRFKKNTRR